MYKKFDLAMLKATKCKFLSNVKNVMNKERLSAVRQLTTSLEDFEYEKIWYESQLPIFRFIRGEQFLHFIDEQEKIELYLEEEQVSELHNLLKRGQEDSAQSILDRLMTQFIDGDYRLIQGKPYIVYDIETTNNFGAQKDIVFEIGYSIQSDTAHSSEGTFKYIAKTSAKKFVDFLVEFDGRVIGFNNVYFDNPVSVYNAGYGEKELSIINQKTIDLFLLVNNLTGKRMGLNKLSTSLLGLSKTLSSGMEGDKLLRQYAETGDKTALEKVKRYCKNDVKMTLAVLLYLLDHKLLYIDGKEYTFTENDVVALSKPTENTTVSESDKGFFE